MVNPSDHSGAAVRSGSEMMLVGAIRFDGSNSFLQMPSRIRNAIDLPGRTAPIDARIETEF